MMLHSQIEKKALVRNIIKGTLTLAGNSRLKIYGKLKCTSGKRMLKENRVFFKNKTEAVQLGYRPCGHCMKIDYTTWKKGQKETF